MATAIALHIATTAFTVGALRQKAARLQYRFVRGRKGVRRRLPTLPADAARYAPTFAWPARSIRFG